MTRWLVRIEIHSLFTLPGRGGYVEYRYYRWRWAARLGAWLRSGVYGFAPLPVFVSAVLLGRVTTR